MQIINLYGKTYDRASSSCSKQIYKISSRH